MKIAVCAPSYRRPKVLTLAYLPFCRIYVDPSEAAAYRTANPGADIIECAPGVQGNLCRVRNHILDHEFATGADVVAIIDDDMTGMGYWENKKQVHHLASDEFMWFIERFSMVARDLGAYFWGVNVNPDPQCYRDCSPFSTVSYIGGPFQVFLSGGKCRYDERLPLKEDYDMTLQQLNRYRVVLRVNKFFYRVKQSEQAGGCASYRNLAEERRQLELLRRKWGSRIVRYDTSDRNHKTTKKRGVTFDYNPVIHPPIRGI